MYIYSLVLFHVCLLHNISCIWFIATVTKELKNFVVDNIPERISDYWIAVANARLAQTIGLATGIPAIAGHIIDEVMRGLRVKFDKFITGLEVCASFSISDHLINDSPATNLVIFFF